MNKAGTEYLLEEALVYGILQLQKKIRRQAKEKLAQT